MSRVLDSIRGTAQMKKKEEEGPQEGGRGRWLQICVEIQGPIQISQGIGQYLFVQLELPQFSLHSLYDGQNLYGLKAASEVGELANWRRRNWHSELFPERTFFSPRWLSIGWHGLIHMMM